MTMIHPTDYDDDAANEIWHDVWETAWRRVEIVGAECAYVSLDGRAQLAVEFTSEVAAANDLKECIQRVVYTAPNGREFRWLCQVR